MFTIVENKGDVLLERFFVRIGPGAHLFHDRLEVLGLRNLRHILFIKVLFNRFW